MPEMQNQSTGAQYKAPRPLCLAQLLLPVRPVLYNPRAHHPEVEARQSDAADEIDQRRCCTHLGRAQGWESESGVSGMTELGLYRVVVQRCGSPSEVNMAAENINQAGEKAIRHFAAEFQDPYIENYKVTPVEQIGSVVI